MQARGIAVEAGLWTTAAALRFVASRMPRYTLRVLIEIGDLEAATAAAEAEAILAVLANAGVALPILLHGAGRQRLADGRDGGRATASPRASASRTAATSPAERSPPAMPRWSQPRRESSRDEPANRRI